MLKRILAVVFALVMVLSVAACGKSGSGNGKDTDAATLDSKEQAIQDYLDTYNPEGTAEDYVDTAVLERDFEGHEFKFLNADEFFYMYLFLDPEMTGDVLDDACYERNFMAEQYFNITITEETQQYGELAAYAKTLILSGEDVYDAMWLPAGDITPLISENLFYDLMEVDELHIDKIWWDQPLITRNIIEDRLFYATSDLHLMAFEGVWCMYFNEDMMIELGLDMPYELALDGKWTLDQVKKYCAAAANLNGDTSFKWNGKGNSVYGVTITFNPATKGNSAVYWLYGMGKEPVSRDENGRYQFTADTDHEYQDALTQLIEFFGPDNGLAVFGAGENTDTYGREFDIFQNGRALFLAQELKGATMLREWEGSFGLLPQPKYNEEQETYNSNVFSNPLSFCIPNTNENLERTGIIVDYLTYMSYESVLPRYYDIHVALKALEKEESIKVLEHIRGTRGIEVSVPFGWTDGMEIGKLITLNENAVASTIEAFRETAIARINKTYEEYPTLNHVEK